MSKAIRAIANILGQIVPRSKASASVCVYMYTNCTNTACVPSGAKGTHYYNCCNVDGNGNVSNCVVKPSSTCCGA